MANKVEFGISQLHVGTYTVTADYYGDNAVGYLSTVAQNYRYTPSNDYDPATKKYVDDKFSA